MNYLTSKQTTEMLSFHLHSAICDMTIPSNEFIFIEEADELMEEFQTITEIKTTKIDMINLVKKYKTLLKAGKLAEEVESLLKTL